MNSKILIITLVALAATGYLVSFDKSTESQTLNNWNSYKAKHNKQYSEEEEVYRFTNYVKNMNDINAHNQRTDVTYSKAENIFADLSKEEFKAIFLGWKQPENKERENVFTGEGKKPAGSIDWTTHKPAVLNAVKDQGQCGSCWAFSTVGSSEAAIAIEKGTLGSFSEQQLVDCDTQCYGCGGGLMDYGFEYFINNFICTEASYKYTAKDGKCKASSCTKFEYDIKKYTDVAYQSTSALQSACDTEPVSIAVDAEEWSFYSGGIFNNCGQSLDHGVVLVGYGSYGWKVRNSWGASWGEEGYIRLAPGNTCGLENSASYPTA